MAEPSQDAGMRRDLGLFSATTLIVGSAIGSGIFLLPSYMAGQVQAPGLLLAVWVLCGLLSLAGALTFAEMAAMFPHAGGQYAFLKEALGRRVAFLYGWTFFWVIQTGIIAAVAWAFALYVGVLFPYATVAWGPFLLTPGVQTKLVALGCILLLSLVNYLGVKYGGLVQNVFTTLKVAAILALVVAGFALGNGSGSVLAPLVPPGADAGLIGAFGLAMVAAFFAYDGWNQASFVASEVRNPQRTVPRAMLLGTLTVMAVYVLATAVYTYVLPFDAVAGTSTLAADVAGDLLGERGRLLITVAIVVSTFGTVNAFILSGPRVYYAMAQDGLFYGGFAKLSKRFATPGFGLLVQSYWACLLVLTGSYNALVNYAVFGIWLFYGVAGVGYFLLRARRPDAQRPYRTTGYPVVPALFVATSAFIVVNSLVNDRTNAGMGMLLILSGIPVLALMAWRQRRAATRGGATAPDGIEEPPARAP